MRAALQPGATACREFRLGISEGDWIKAQVIEATADRARLRVADAGRFPHMLGGEVLAVGKIVEDALEDWTPCS